MLGSPTSSWMTTSPLEILITRACEPSLPEPNYALHLEVAEYINQKKANTAREAATLLVRLSNHRNPHVGMLALALVDTLVQSCGYAFHLQVGTKEFLNELVRRFPERPPPFPGPVMQRILDLIHTWKETICMNSRYKQDLGNIRDMHRLLTFKGYRFRESRGNAPATATTANLKSAEELEEEDREAQSAKLQELIRRGTPRDLAAAQEIMKTLAGANPDAKPDYRAQALTELNKLEQKVILLNELLDNFDTERGERFASGDAYDQVAGILTAARPKIQKWISDAESDDSESLDTFLQINDQINTVVNRYDAFKRGDYAAASNPIPAELASTSQTTQNLSLIDFDDSPASPAAAAASNADVLADLFGPAQTSPMVAPVGSAFAQGVANGGARPLSAASNGFGSIMLPGTPGASAQPVAAAPPGWAGAQHADTQPSWQGAPQPMGYPGAQQPGGAPGWMGAQHSGGGMPYQHSGAGPAISSQPPGYFVGSSRTGTPMGAPMQPARATATPQPQSQAPPKPAPAGKDPFADLAGLF